MVQQLRLSPVAPCVAGAGSRKSHDLVMWSLHASVLDLCSSDIGAPPRRLKTWCTWTIVSRHCRRTEICSTLTVQWVRGVWKGSHDMTAKMATYRCRQTYKHTSLCMSGRLLCQPPSLGITWVVTERAGEGMGGGYTHEHPAVSELQTGWFTNHYSTEDPFRPCSSEAMPVWVITSCTLLPLEQAVYGQYMTASPQVWEVCSCVGIWHLYIALVLAFMVRASVYSMHLKQTLCYVWGWEG